MTNHETRQMKRAWWVLGAASLMVLLAIKISFALHPDPASSGSPPSTAAAATW